MTQEVKRRAILDPAIIEHARPVANAVAAVLGLGNSAVTTVLSAMWIEQRVAGEVTYIAWAAGIALAVVLTLGQLFTRPRLSPSGEAIGDPVWYAVWLAPDLGLTTAQHCRWLVPLGLELLGPAGAALAVGIALFIGWHSSRKPEQLIFGKS